MTAYIITRKESEFLDSPVFHAGADNEQEAIAVFTNREPAQEYIETAGWSCNYEVGELRPLQIVKWFECAHEEGVHLVVINPNRDWHLFGDRQEVISLDEPREAFAQLLQTKLISKAEGAMSAESDDEPNSIAQALHQFAFSRR